MCNFLLEHEPKVKRDINRFLCSSLRLRMKPDMGSYLSRRVFLVSYRTLVLAAWAAIACDDRVRMTESLPTNSLRKRACSPMSWGSLRSVSSSTKPVVVVVVAPPDVKINGRTVRSPYFRIFALWIEFVRERRVRSLSSSRNFRLYAICG